MKSDAEWILEAVFASLAFIGVCSIIIGLYTLWGMK